jgi:hypothetical protein
MLYFFRTLSWFKIPAQETLVLVSFFLSVSVVTALTQTAPLGVASLTLTWQPSPDVKVVGYNVYYGTASRAYTNKISFGNATTATISNLVDGTTYYFAATAYDIEGKESAFSTEAIYTIPLELSNQPRVMTPAKNPNGQFSFAVSGVVGRRYIVESSTNLVDWVLVDWVQITTNHSIFTFTTTNMHQFKQQFFRVVNFPSNVKPDSN